MKDNNQFKNLVTVASLIKAANSCNYADRPVSTADILTCHSRETQVLLINDNERNPCCQLRGPGVLRAGACAYAC